MNTLESAKEDKLERSFSRDSHLSTSQNELPEGERVIPEMMIRRSKLKQISELKFCKSKLLEIIKKHISPKKENFILSMDTLKSQRPILLKNRILAFKFLRIFEVKWLQNSQLRVE